MSSSMSRSTSAVSIPEGSAAAVKPSRPAVESRLHDALLNALEPALDLACGDLPLVGDVRAGGVEIRLDCGVEVGVGDVRVHEQLANEVGVLDVGILGFEHRPEIAVLTDEFDGRLRPDARYAVVEVRPTEDTDVDELFPREIMLVEGRVERHTLGITLAGEIAEGARRAEQQSVVVLAAGVID